MGTVQIARKRDPIAYPVLAETYVSRLMDGNEFRAHCDQYRTRSESLRHL